MSWDRCLTCGLSIPPAYQGQAAGYVGYADPHQICQCQVQPRIQRRASLELPSNDMRIAALEARITALREALQTVSTWDSGYEACEPDPEGVDILLHHVTRVQRFAREALRKDGEG